MSKSVTSYIAVLADAVGSRRLAAPARQALQRQLRTVIVAVNRKWRGARSGTSSTTCAPNWMGIGSSPAAAGH